MIHIINKYIREHWRTIVVAMVGLVVFAALNILMLQTNYDLWTRPKVGFFSAFHKGFEFSGFDGPTYIVISQWRPLFTLFRHPMLALMLWPLSEVNEWLKDATDMNCAIHIVAVVWTLLAVTSWCLLHRLMHKVVGISWAVSLLLCFFYFGFAYVMLATFVPDHMMISMTFFLLTLWLACKADAKGKPLKGWKALLIAFFAMGVSTTNIAKVWLIDMMSRIGRTTWSKAFRHSLLYFIPLAIVGSIYFVQLNTTQKASAERSRAAEQKRLATDSTFSKEVREKQKRIKAFESKQLNDSRLFEWTDVTIPRIQTLYENVFGEGLILHEDHLLEDANAKDGRPVFVAYRAWWYYAIETIIVALFVAGMWCGRRERLMWMLLALMGFDALLHIGFCFAIADIYIMTAHWAFIMPVSVAYLLRSVADRRAFFVTLTGVVLLVTAFLWYHNVTLIAQHILG